MNAHGGAFQVEGALLALIGGPNRISLLTLNLVYFVALQSAVFWTVRRWLGSAPLAQVGVAMLVACGSYFQPAGGVFGVVVQFESHPDSRPASSVLVRRWT